jgi:hypothetical protein
LKYIFAHVNSIILIVLIYYIGLFYQTGWENKRRLSHSEISFDAQRNTQQEIGCGVLEPEFCSQVALMIIRYPRAENE